MGALEEQARFLTAKYGTAAGPTGLPHVAPAAPNLALIMIVLGLLIFVAILAVLFRDLQSQRVSPHR
jgi:hypothetical protein